MGIYDRDYYQPDQMRPLRPWDGKTMVTMLIVANVVVLLANFLFGGRSNWLAEALALRPADLWNPLQWYHLVTYGFVHDPRDIFHLLFNMVTLYFLGRHVEDKYGKWEFFRIYMISLVACGIGWCLLRTQAAETNFQLVGASGAATAVAMLFVYSFPKATLMLYGVLPIKAWVVGILIVVGNIFGSSNRVAYDVHLIGAVLATVYFFANLNFGFMSGLFDRTKVSIRQRRKGFKVLHSDAAESGSSGRSSTPSREEQEADRLLDKIHRDGKDSLTAKERSFLENYSRKVRESRK